MALQSGFFTSNNGDRLYQSEFFTSYFGSFIGNGVFPNPSNNLQVIANQNLTVNVSAGKGWINGYYLRNTSAYSISLPSADGTLNRIDRIVFALNFTTRQIEVYAKSGVLSSNPVAPTLQRDATIYELALADIRINAGTVNITQAQITDLRPNANLCGIVSGTIQQVDVTTLYNQYATEFEQMTAQQRQQFADFIAQLEDVLDENTASNLLNLINGLDDRVTALESQTADVATEAEAIAGTENTKTMTPLRTRQAIDNTPSIVQLQANTVKKNNTNQDNTITGFQGTATRVFDTNFGSLGQNGDFTVLIPKTNFNGTIEVNITSQYANTNATGGMKVVYHAGFYQTAHYIQMEVLECSDVLRNEYFVTDLSDDGSVYYFRIIKRRPDAVNGTRISITFTGPINAGYLAENCSGVFEARTDSLPFEINSGVSQEIRDLKLSGVSAKTLIANALTAKGIPSNNNEDFSIYADKITALPTKISASGTVEAINSSNVFPLSTGVTSPFTTVRVDGLGFRPSKINIWRRNGNQRFITIYDARSEPFYAFVGDFQSNTSSSNINYVDVSSASYLYDGGFFFPVIGSGSQTFEWYAEE